MTEIARRDLLVGGLALAGGVVWPGMAAAAAATTASPPPRERLLFDFGWKFRLGHGSDPAQDLGFGLGQSDFSKTGEFGFAHVGFNDADWRTLDLPHDWAVELPFVRDDTGQGDSQSRSHGYKPLGRRYPATSVGWYRREFDLPKTDAGRRIWVEFDGAMRDVLVFVNGCFVGRSDSGYAPFRLDLTDVLDYGARNAIVLRVDASAGDGWFYEGAGVYRHAWLLKTDPLHLGRWDNVVRTTVEADTARAVLSALVHNEGSADERARVVWRVLDAEGREVARAASAEQGVAAQAGVPFEAKVEWRRPRLWDLETPHRYTAQVTLEAAGIARDVDQVAFGVRTVAFDADRGFFLNGRSVKIQGVCNHQDHAGVGAAVPDALQAFRVQVMQEMGCNAIRTSHNMPAPELVEACDRMGVLLLCENRQLASSTEGLQQLETMVTRYRNSPSVMLWSIGNEEGQLQKPMAAQGARIAETLVRRCHQLDPTRLVTVAVNSDNEQGVSDAVDVVGFNYNQWLPDGFHARHPKRPVLGTETSSAVSTRGEYATDASRNLMSSYDGKVSWGSTPEEWWKFHAERPWLAGGFAWTGFDYRGEPTPYGWPSISSQFGIVDTCGYPKDYFHYYRAWWRKQAALHLFPHWNWQGQEGREIPVWVYANVDEVELLVNGRSLGRRSMPRLGHLAWKVAYAPGAIEARGYKAGRLVLTERRETTGPAAALRLVPHRPAIAADGEDVAVVRVEAVDAQGRTVPTANHGIVFRVTGAGRLAGVGNGDPNCLESDQAPRRSLFNGLAQLIVRAGKEAGEITIEASGEGAAAGLERARLTVPARVANKRPSVA
jgi:beta-galactosidase